LEAAIQSVFSISLPVYTSQQDIYWRLLFRVYSLFPFLYTQITKGYLLEAAIQSVISISLPVYTSQQDIYWRLLFRDYSLFPFLYPHHTRISIGGCYSEFIPPSPYIHTTQGYQLDAAIQSLFSLPLISTPHKDINWMLLFRVYSPFPLYPHHTRISIGGCYTEFIPLSPSCTHITVGYQLEAAIQSLFSLSFSIPTSHKESLYGDCYTV
jgi:hypothetical protein